MRELVPPVLLKMARAIGRLAQRNGPECQFSGSYSNWEHASRAADGYQSPWILERVRHSTARVRDGLAAYERDGVTFDRLDYPWPLLACLMRIALENGSRLRILDYGGSLGSTYFQCRGSLTGLSKLIWNVVEQAHFVECGRREFQTEQLRFAADVDSCLTMGEIDLILLSSALPYLPRPYAILEDLVNRPVPWLLIDRTPVIDANADRLALQQVPAWVYGKAVRYPAWLLSRERIARLCSRTHQLVLEFPGWEGKVAVGNQFAHYIGQLWRKTS